MYGSIIRYYDDTTADNPPPHPSLIKRRQYGISAVGKYRMIYMCIRGHYCNTVAGTRTTTRGKYKL